MLLPRHDARMSPKENPPSPKHGIHDNNTGRTNIRISSLGLYEYSLGVYEYSPGGPSWGEANSRAWGFGTELFDHDENRLLGDYLAR